MKRLCTIIASTASTLILTTGVALAQTYPPPTGTGPSVEAASGGGVGSTAFTGGGSALDVAALVALALIVVGSLALWAVRRRHTDLPA